MKRFSADRLLFNFRIGMEAIANNRLRTFLTSLGIVFGVAAVISMLAIGKGAEKEILDQLKQVGSNNIVVKGLTPEELKKASEKDNSNSEKPSEKENSKPKYSPGITMADVENIETTLKDYIENVSPELEKETELIYNASSLKVKVTGVKNSFFDNSNYEIAYGRIFTEAEIVNSAASCVIGSSLNKKFFTGRNPVGERIKCGTNWFTIVGVLQEKYETEKINEKFSSREGNSEVFVPVNTFLARIKNNSKVKLDLGHDWDDDDEPKKPESYHTIDKLVVKVKNTEELEQVAEVVHKLLLRKHNEVEDFQIVIPQLLIKQEQKTKSLFNLVLSIIASISLLVGGIGIMNTMLATVLERIREIGLRLSIGARKKDIVQQFLSEAVSISVSGGILGIILGVAISFIIEFATDIHTIVSPVSILLSFTISISVGIIFGLAPAQKAAAQDPVESLRHE